MIKTKTTGSPREHTPPPYLRLQTLHWVLTLHCLGGLPVDVVKIIDRYSDDVVIEVVCFRWSLLHRECEFRFSN